MKTSIAVAAWMIAGMAGVEASTLNVHWDIAPANSARYLLTIDRDTGLASWNRSDFWVSPAAAAATEIFNPGGLLGGHALPPTRLLKTFLVWPDGSSSEWQWLQYHSGTDRFEAPGTDTTFSTLLAPDLARLFEENQLRMTLDPSRGDVLDGPLVHAPEPQTIALIFSTGLVGLALHRRFRPSA